MPTTKMIDKTIGLVEVGNISEAMRLAAEEAGDPNMKITHVKISICIEFYFIRLLNGSKNPVIPSK